MPSSSPSKNYVLPNGGWGWMVVLGVALTNMFNQSIISLFGLLFGDHLQNLGQGTFGAAFVMNLNSVALNFSGIITGPALKAYSPRQVAMLGSILTSVGLILSSWSVQLWQISIAYGLLVGIGLGLISPSSFISVNSYFSTKRGTAVGLALAGTGLGQMVMPHIVSLLLDYYEFKGTILILGALSLNGMVGAALFQPVEWHMKPFVEENKLLLKPKIVANKSSDSECDDDDEDDIQETEILSDNIKYNDFNSKDTVPLTSTTQPSSKITSSLRSRISKAMDLQLLKDPIFVSIAIGLALAYTASTNFSMIFPYFLQESVHLSRSDTALCMSILAAADLVSRLTLPTITDKLKVSCRMTFLVGAILLTCTRATLAETSNRTNLIIMSAVYGYVRAATVVNQNLVISEYTCQEKLASALGLNMIAKGFLVITLGQILGWIRDHTGSYPICLHAQNILLFIVIILWTPEILYAKYKAFSSRKKQHPPVDI